MAQNTTISVPATTWTLLTDGNISSITFQNIGNNALLIKGTVGTTPPSDANGALRYNPRQGERNAALTDLFPGLSGANRVYAYADDAVQVVVSHA